MLIPTLTLFIIILPLFIILESEFTIFPIISIYLLIPISIIVIISFFTIITVLILLQELLIVKPILPLLIILFFIYVLLILLWTTIREILFSTSSLFIYLFFTDKWRLLILCKTHCVSTTGKLSDARHTILLISPFLFTLTVVFHSYHIRVFTSIHIQSIFPFEILDLRVSKQSIPIIERGVSEAVNDSVVVKHVSGLAPTRELLHTVQYVTHAVVIGWSQNAIITLNIIIHGLVNGKLLHHRRTKPNLFIIHHLKCIHFILLLVRILKLDNSSFLLYSVFQLRPLSHLEWKEVNLRIRRRGGVVGVEAFGMEVLQTEQTQKVRGTSWLLLVSLLLVLTHPLLAWNAGGFLQRMRLFLLTHCNRPTHNKPPLGNLLLILKSHSSFPPLLLLLNHHCLVFITVSALLVTWASISFIVSLLVRIAAVVATSLSLKGLLQE